MMMIILKLALDFVGQVSDLRPTKVGRSDVIFVISFSDDIGIVKNHSFLHGSDGQTNVGLFSTDLIFLFFIFYSNVMKIIAFKFCSQCCEMCELLENSTTTNTNKTNRNLYEIQK